METTPTWKAGRLLDRIMEEMTQPGKSVTKIIEPIEVPDYDPAALPEREPEPLTVPDAPDREKEPVHAIYDSRLH